MQPSPPEPGNTFTPAPRPNLLAGQQLPPPPQQERSRRKRHALLQSALALFAQRGYEDTTIEDIARQAGVAVGGFYQHFASKRQILIVLMDSLAQDAASVTLELTGTDRHAIRDALARLIRQAFQIDWAYVGVYRAWREAAVRDRELQTLYQQIETWVVQQITLLFQALLHLPGARPNVDSATLAWEIALLLLRLSETPLPDPNPIVASLTHLIYHALFTDAAAP
ncbi:MAG TPA: TetR/AcrR family transcriptional regulator [Ktedonobacterales bacterium]|nr:TetR/AcrR family transcriptional regulator [Ktedonobacterales bacterium]